MLITEGLFSTIGKIFGIESEDDKHLTDVVIKCVTYAFEVAPTFDSKRAVSPGMDMYIERADDLIVPEKYKVSITYTENVRVNGTYTYDWKKKEVERMTPLFKELFKYYSGSDVVRLYYCYETDQLYSVPYVYDASTKNSKTKTSDGKSIKENTKALHKPKSFKLNNK